LLAPRDFLRRPPSVGTCPPVMTYKANPGRTRPFHFSLVRRQKKPRLGRGFKVMTNRVRPVATAAGRKTYDARFRRSRQFGSA
jgi:hypothetical protein